MKNICMKPSLFVRTIIVGFGLVMFPAVLGAAESPTPTRIRFFTKSAGYEHSAIRRGPNGEPSPAEKVLQELGPKHHFEFTFSKDGTIFTPENLRKFDAFFFYTTGDLTTSGGDHNPPMSKDAKAAFL